MLLAQILSIQNISIRYGVNSSTQVRFNFHKHRSHCIRSISEPDQKSIGYSVNIALGSKRIFGGPV